MIATQEDTARAWRLVGEALASGLRPPEPMTVTEWADRHRYFRRYENAPVLKWRTRDRAYLLGIQNARHEAGVRFVAVMAAEQVGKTEAALNVLGHSVQLEPGPVLCVYPTIPLARKAGKSRITPMFKAVPSLAPRLLLSKHETNASSLVFEHMTLAYAGSESDSGLESYPYRLRIVDELDRCRPGTAGKIQGRGAIFSSEGDLTFAMSTPEVEHDGIHAEFMLGDRRHFHVPCPHCGVFHRRLFDLVEWPGKGEPKARPAMEILLNAFLRCPNQDCRKEVHGHHSAWQQERGVWAPEGLTPQPAAADWALSVIEDPSRWSPSWIRELRELGLLTGEPAGTIAGDGGPGSGGDRASFMIDGLLSPEYVNPYGQLAKEFVDAGSVRTRDFVNKREGRPWSRGRKVEPSSLRAACPAPGQGGFLSWQVPATAPLLLTAADVQDHFVYHLTVAVEDHGRKVWVVGAGRVDRVVKDGLANLWPAIARDYPVVDFETGDVLGRRVIMCGGVDSADVSTEVYVATADRCFEGWAAVAGRKLGPIYAIRGNARLDEIIEWRVRDKLPISPAGFGRKAHLLNFRHAKFAQDVQDLVDSVQPDRLAMGGSPVQLRLPYDAPDELLEQLASERLEEVLKGGRRQLEWRVLPGKENHWRDCLKMALAMATAFGLEKLKPYRFQPEPPAQPEQVPEARPRRAGWMSRMTGG